MIVVGGLCGAIGWQAGVRRATTPPKPPAVGTTQATVEAIWGEPVDSTSFTVELNGEPVTIVTSKYVKNGTRIEVEYDRGLMAKKVEVLE